MSAVHDDGTGLASFKSIYQSVGHIGKDLHRMYAASIFKVPEEEVTPEQRRMAKSQAFFYMYNPASFEETK